MNDNDIIKALECCAVSNCLECCAVSNCDDCPYFKFGNCLEKLQLDAVDLINRLKAENERLTINMNAFGLGMKYEKERADTARAEAIKEFAERIEPKLAHNTDISAVGYHSVIADIQSVVKEMTEEQSNDPKEIH